jgi:hypothetical protein
MNTPTLFERELGKSIRTKFGEKTKVVRFADDDEVNNVFIVSGMNHPIEGVISYGSIGLSRFPQRVEKTELKVEIVAACAAVTPNVDNLVASCVFDSVKNGSRIGYGSCISDIVVQYGISNTLKHVVFVAPFLWHGMDKLTVEGETIHCLMMLPISDAERQYLEARGIDALENVFNEKQIDIFDINRPSVL